MEEYGTLRQMADGPVVQATGRRARARPVMTAPGADGQPPLGRWIVSVARARDRTAFSALFDHFAPRLKAFFMARGASPDLAEEIVQETMVTVWHKAEQFDPGRAAAATWVFAIARNKRTDLLRRRARPEADMTDPAIAPEPPADGFDTLSGEEEARRLRAAVDTLPPEQTSILRLAFYEEKTHQRIAEDLGLPLGTVKSRIRLAMTRIRAVLGPEE